MNPFQPTFGKNPPTVIGRESVVENFIEGLDEGVGDERRATLFVGQRGMGKTVVLNQLARRAREKKWFVAEVTNNKAMLEDIYDQLLEQGSKGSKRGVTGISVSALGFGAGINTENTTRSDSGWRMRITRVLDELKKSDTGVLFTIDEIHANSDELRQFATSYQHFVREDRKVAVAMAGLPNEISGLLNDKILTFLRRASKVTLTNIESNLVELGMLRTIEDNSRTISPELLKTVTEATGGYPYLIQLIGSNIWRIHPQNKEISAEDVRIGIPLAQEKLFENIVEPVLQELSAKDIVFLRAMSLDDDVSQLSELQKRMKVSQSYISQYRRRLLSADVINSTKRGYVQYAIPQMGNYFKEQRQGHGSE